MNTVPRVRPSFKSTLKKHGLNAGPKSIETLWLNITRKCNQACRHCHLEAGPGRIEMMDRDTMDACLSVLARYDSIRNIDITGGAPELHPDFMYLVKAASGLGKHLLVRHNLTVILDSGDNLPGIFAEHDIELIASLPHYERRIFEMQRGEGVFEKSLEGLRRLNEVGYGREGTGLIINLVSNVDVPVSPNGLQKLEEDYRQALRGRYDLVFNRLYAVTNVPIGRFHETLISQGQDRRYLAGLAAAFSPASVEELVCRSRVSIDHDGRLYDCDFNLARGLTIGGGNPRTVFDFDYDELVGREIRFAEHCFGCTAGGGSS